MKPIFQAGRGDVRGIVVARGLALVIPPVWVLSTLAFPALSFGEERDPLAEARAALAQKRDEADQRRSVENPDGWTKLTNRNASPFQRSRAEEDKAAQVARASQGPSPYNPKFGAPTFQMPGTPAQDASAPQLKQFHPTQEPGAEAKGVRRFLARDRVEGEETCPEDAERRARAAAEGKKSTLSYTGEDPAKERMRTYDEIYQSKSPHALPSFQMPSGPAASLASPGAQTWGGRVLTQYRPETEAKGLERARMQREQRAEEREARRDEGGSGLRDMFDRTKKLESH